MEFRLIFLCSLLVHLGVIGSYANDSLHREGEELLDYWKEAFPNVELPKALEKYQVFKQGVSDNVGKDSLNHNVESNSQRYYALDALENDSKYIFKHDVKSNWKNDYIIGTPKNADKDVLNHDVEPNWQKNYAFGAPKNVWNDNLLNHDVKPNWQKNYGVDVSKNVGKYVLNHDVEPNWQKNYVSGAPKNVGKDNLLNHDVKPYWQKNYGIGSPKNVGKYHLNHDVEPKWKRYYTFGFSKDVKPNWQKNYALGVREDVKPDWQKNYVLGVPEDVKPNWQKNYALGVPEDVKSNWQKNYALGVPEDVKSNWQKNYALGSQEHIAKDPRSHNTLMEDSHSIEDDVIPFFIENDLKSGKKIKLHFSNPINEAKFLPHEIAKSIPFSSKMIQDILNRFDIKPESIEGKIVKQTIKECEEPTGIKGEHKFCATSLESLIDFSRSKLGKNIKVYTTEENKEIKQVYNIVKGSVYELGDKAVVCHKENYMYAVYYCHQIHETRVYMASLEGVDGTKVNAVAACHANTKDWNPKHLAFQLLNIKPGTTPVCHFLSSDTLVLVSKKGK